VSELSLSRRNEAPLPVPAAPHARNEYEEFYALAEAPFSGGVGLRFAYPAASYRSALDDVRHGLQRGHGVIVVTGEPGTGKTLLCRALLEESDARTFMSVVLDPCVSIDALLVQVLTDFGVVKPGAKAGSRQDLTAALQRFLVSLLRIGARAVIVIEEAQHLHPAVLEQLRLWSNFESDDAKLLQVVLVGQPGLDEVLRRQDMQQIAQRVSQRIALEPMSREEVGGYIEHRLGVASGSAGDADGQVITASRGGLFGQTNLAAVRFTPAAVRVVAAESGGVPRMVNALCDRALQIGCERRVMTIDVRMARKAARSLGRQRSSIVPRTTTARASVGAAVLALIVAVPAVWARVEGKATPRSAGGASATEQRAAAAVLATAADGARAPGGGSISEAADVTGTLAVSDSLTISVATFKTEQRAAAVAAQLVDEGFPAFSRSDASGLVHQVIIGPYLSADEVAEAKRAMTARGISTAEVRLDRARLD
jgi:general secretion pathway protein A